MTAQSDLTEQTVARLLQSTRSRRLQYLCRAYLQFGEGCMMPSDADEIRKAMRKRGGK